MVGRTTLLEDSFEFQTVPFIVRVEVQERFVNGKTGESRGVNFHNAPTGMKRVPSKSWVICECVHARVRPDYPYTIREEWPENVDKHFHSIVPLEEPVKSRGLLFTSWDSERKRTIQDIDEKELAEKTITKMKQAYENRHKVSELTVD